MRGAWGLVDRDGDVGRGVVDLSWLVQEVAGDRTVLVGVGEVAVQGAGEVKLDAPPGCPRSSARL
jgi:hypothetical protein